MILPLLAGAAFLAAQEPPSRPLHALVTDPLAKENSCACVEGYAQRDYAALAARLSARLGRPVQLHFRAEAEPDLVFGKAAGPAAPLAHLTDLEGAVTFRGLFVVRAADPAGSIADLKGRSILFGPAGSPEKREAAFEALRRAGVPVPDAPAARDSCTEAAVAVVRKEADAAVISSYALPLIEGCKAVARGEIKVVGRTAPVPFVVARATDRLLPADREAVLGALLEISEDPEVLRKLESRGGFVPPDPAGWTDWRGGPRRDARRAGLPESLPARPRFLWRRPLLGQSLGGIAVASGRVILSDKSPDGAEDVWRCLEADTGKDVWQVRVPAAGKMDYTNAPRATPVVVEDQVYLLGAFGDLLCVSLDRGEAAWRRNLVRDFGGKVPTWGLCGAPLVLEDRVIVRTPGPEAALVALDRAKGGVLWKTPGRPPGYGNLVAAVLGGRLQIVGLDAASAGGWDPETGERLWTLVPPEGEEFNVPTPVVVGGKLLLAAEKNGTRLYRFRDEGEIDPEPEAANKDLAPSTASPVVMDGRVWGASDDGTFCLDLADGLRTAWHLKEAPFSDPASLIAGNGRVLLAFKRGALALLPSRPAAATKPAVLEVFPREGDFDADLWSHPALVGDRLYLRAAKEAACLLLSE
jgi:outer membrane protein assembly factor BamB